ncbi:MULTISPECIES: BglG family transcription antiterminator [Niallia]|uniref:Ascorbate-specific PTS system EIIA component n=1 Tax=Niallia circulans TaxID=1397 RepID=A0A941GG03_NIACI|nr:MULTISPECIES: BglG family transcription antiterminator [Niallia]MCB5236195.1 BglG family transcription antiterminator [Niallia circulans]MED3791012.1 BglG family transcription antiterminator [Niallia alba]UTI42523.1 BglG family transcription antiterminator [Niallia sp. RD1]
MYLDERSNILLKEVLSNPDTSNIKLEKKFHLSRRQVSYSFQKINDWLESNNYPAIKRTNGGKFIISPVIMELFAEKTDEQADKHYIPSETERAQFILLYIISSDDELSLLHFTSALGVSKNTILRDMKTVQQMIEPYELEVSYSRMKGYELKGKEWNVRKLLVEVLENILSIYNGEIYIQKFINVPKDNLITIKERLAEVECSLNLQFIDERINLLPYILAVILKRIQKGKVIQDFYHIDYRSLSDTKEFIAAEILIKDIKHIPKEEHLFMTLQLLTSKILSAQFLADHQIPELTKALETFLHTFEYKACIAFKDKAALLERLVLHMKPAYYRMKYNLSTNYTMMEKVSEEFETIHFIVKDSIAPVEEYIGCPIPESELMFITIFVGGHLISSGETIQKKKKAVVVCPNGVSISRLMESTLRELFPEFYFHQALSIREFHQLNYQVDIIFSPVPLQTDTKQFVINRILSDFEKVQLRQRVLREIFDLNTNVINIEQLMGKIEKYASIKDKESLRDALQEHFTITTTSETQEPMTKTDLSLASLLTPEMITVVQSVEDWQQGIQIAAGQLLKNGSITENYVEEMLKQYPAMVQHIVLRNVIAIPHADPEAGVNRVGMSLLKIEDGIPFNEKVRVHFIVVLASTDKHKHLYALRQLMSISKNGEEISNLKISKNPEQLYEIIKKYS